MHLMKMITAVVRPFKLDELRQAIAQLGVQGVTVTEVYEAQFGPRAKVEIAVDDAIVEPVLEAIANVSRTGRVGDGRILRRQSSSRPFESAPARPAPLPPESPARLRSRSDAEHENLEWHAEGLRAAVLNTSLLRR